MVKELSSAAPVTSASYVGRESNPDLTLRVVTETAEFAALEKEWNQLSDRCPDTDIFATWTWLYHWWQTYGQDYELRLYLVRDTTGRLRGILPCYLREVRAFKLIRFYELRMVGTGGGIRPDYLDLLAAPRDRGAVTSLIIPHLLSESAVWDVLCMDNLPAESPFTRRLPREMPGHQFVRQRTPVPIIELPPTWGDYLRTLSDNRRGEVQNHRRRFHREVEGRHFVWDKHHELDDAIDQLVKLHRLQGPGVDDARPLSSKASAAFHRQLMRKLFDRNQLRLHCLEADDEIIGMLYCYWWRGTVYYFQGGFDPRFKYLSPESVLVPYAIESAIAHGAVRFDMLKGNYAFKRSLATQTRETISLGAYRESTVGAIARFGREILPAVKRAVLGRPKGGRQGPAPVGGDPR